MGNYWHHRRNVALCRFRLPFRKHAVEGFAHVGYPQQLRILLGIAKPLGAIVLLIPGFIKLKEWAYAGFTFAWIAATVAHYLAKDGPRAFSPVVLLILLVVSYVTRQSALGVRSRRNLTLPATDVGGVKREDSQG